MHTNISRYVLSLNIPAPPSDDGDNGDCNNNRLNENDNDREATASRYDNDWMFGHSLA